MTDKNVNIWIDEDLWYHFRETASCQGQTLKGALRIAINRYLSESPLLTPVSMKEIEEARQKTEALWLLMAELLSQNEPHEEVLKRMVEVKLFAAGAENGELVMEFKDGRYDFQMTPDLESSTP